MKLKSTLRFLRKRPTTTYLHEWKDHQGDVTEHTESDWVGWKLIQRSTSGGVVLRGSHLLLHYSRIQAGVPLAAKFLVFLNFARSPEMTLRSRSTVILLQSKASWSAVDVGK